MTSFQKAEGNTQPGTHHEEHAIRDAKVHCVAGQSVGPDIIQHLSPEQNRRVLRRVDIVLMPIMFISYGLQYMDKAILGAASQFRIVEDVGLYEIVILDGQPQIDLKKFSLATLIFYWGFAAGGKTRHESSLVAFGFLTVIHSSSSIVSRSALSYWHIHWDFHCCLGTRHYGYCFSGLLL